MDIASHMRLSIALLFLIFAVQASSQPSSPSTVESGERSSSGAIQNTSPQAVTQPTAQPAAGHINREPTPNQSSIPCVASSPTEPKESFSQLTLFLFGSGLAIFIALLGWSDQIRGIDRDTRDLEERFLKKTGINKSHFVEIVKSGEPEKQLVALTQAINDGKITSNVSVEVLESFDRYMTKLRPLEKLSDRKYKTTIALTIVLFVSGIVSLFTNPTLALLSIRVEIIILIVPMILIGVLLIIIISSAAKEKVLRSLLSSMSDMV